MNTLGETTATNDADLLIASRAGGVEAFGQLVERYQNLVCAVAYSNTGDRLLSEDIGQETFLTAWHKLDTVREPEKLRSWLCSIARNLSSKALRVRKRESMSDSETLDRNASVDPGPLAAVLTKETEATVWQALEDLPETFREPLVLFYREDKSIKQVALGLGLSEDAAKQRLSRGRQALKEGVSNLVEQTLESSRPNKAFTAAVLGLVGTAVAPGSAAAAGTAKASGGAAASTARGMLVWIGLAAVAVLALVAGVVVMRSSDAKPLSGEQIETAKSMPDREVLAFLHNQRSANTTAASAPCEFCGSVLDSSGTTIPGALVAIVANSMQSNVLDPTSIQTDADGSWRSGSLREGSYLVSITAPGHLAETRTEQCDASSASKPLDVPLSVGGTRLHDTVTDIGGGPVAEVAIWLLPTLGKTGTAITARTAKDGTYEVSIHPDRYMMLTVHPDYVLDARPILVTGESTKENFVVLPGAVIEGTVVNDAGAPVVGASVSTGGVSLQHLGRSDWMFAALFGAMFPALSDAQGRYRIGGLPPGVTQIHARTTNLISRNPALAELGIAETETGVDVTVAKAFSVSAFVVDKDNPRKGMANVHVFVQQDRTISTPNLATTDTTGYFEIAGVEPGTYRIISVGRMVAPLVADTIITVTDENIGDVLIKAKEGVSLVGKISPPGRAALHLEPASVGGDSESAFADAVASMAHAEVDASGQFRFPAVANGDYVIVANTIDGEGRTPVTVAGSEITGLNVNIETLVAIRGRVLDDSGSPVGGVLVAVTPKRSSAPRAIATQMHTRNRTNSDGQFEIIGLYPAQYDLRIFDGSALETAIFAASGILIAVLVLVISHLNLVGKLSARLAHASTSEPGNEDA